MSKGHLLWPLLLLLIVTTQGKPVTTSVPVVCRKVSWSMTEGGSVCIPLHTVETSFHVYRLDGSASHWEEILVSLNGISQPPRIPLAEKISVSSRGFEVEHMSRGAEGSYQVVSTITGECVAHIDLGVLDPTPSPPVLGTPPQGEGDLSKNEKGGPLSDAARIALVVAGALALQFLLLLLAVYMTLSVCINKGAAQRSGGNP
ncbi:unnamed protein product [Lepidochelys olivacea]